MPPSPIDSRNVYAKTLHAARMADEHLMRVEIQNRLQAKLAQEMLNKQTQDQVEFNKDREPSRRVRDDDQREPDKRKKKKRRDEDDEDDTRAEGDEDERNELRKRRPDDDAGKGDHLDVKG